MERSQDGLRSALYPAGLFAGVVEVSGYVSEFHRSKGIGTALLRQLIDESEQEGIWTLQAGIFPENNASMQLHEKLGFRRVGIRENPGQMNGRWRDVVLLELRNDIL